MSSLPDRIHVTGGSGSGTSTLGRTIARRHGHRHLDTDDYFWEQTSTPYTVQRPKDAVVRMLREELVTDRSAPGGRWVLTGAIGRWGYELADRFDLVIWLTLPPDVRLERLAGRERSEFGSRIAPGGSRHDEFVAFMEWAARYDTAGTEMRSFARHSGWTSSLACPVVRVDGVFPVDETLAIVEREWRSLER